MPEKDLLKQNYSTESLSIQRESELINAAKAKDIDAFKKLFLIFAPVVYRYLAYFLNSSSEAQNITSIVFIKVWQEIELFNVRENTLIVWIFELSDPFINLEIPKKMRIEGSIKRERSALFPESQDLEFNKAKENSQNEPNPILLQNYKQTSNLIFNLPEFCRLVVYLRYIEELSFYEISQMLKLPLVKVRALHNEALGLLYKSYQSEVS